MKEHKHHWTETLTGIAFAQNTLVFMVSLHFWQWHWFARSGALMVAIGIILTGTQFIEAYNRYLLLYYNPDLPDDSPVEPVIKERRLRWGVEYVGFVLLVWGTLIWGFGDIPNVISPTTPAWILNIK